MLDFGKKSRFITTDTRALYGVLEVLKFYELIGINYIYIDIISNISTILSSLVSSNKFSCTIEDLKKTISDNSFRLDLIVIQNYKNYYIDTSFTDIPIIFLENPEYISIDTIKVDNTYKFSVDQSNWNAPASITKGSLNIKTVTTATVINLTFNKRMSRYIVEDVDNNWSASLDDLKVRYIRNKKLDDLFGLN